MTVLYYPPSVNGLQKTLGAQLDQAETSSMTLNNTTSIQDEPGVVVVNRIDTNGDEKPTSEREYISYAGVSGSTLTGLTRGLGGSSDQDHATGSVVEFILDMTAFQSVISALANLVDPDDIDTFQNLTAGVSAASTSAAGKVELAVASEVNTGTDTGRAISPDSLAGSNFGTRGFSVQAIGGATTLTTGDGKAYFRVPSVLNGHDIIGVAAQVVTTSSSGNPTIQIARGRQSSPTSNFTYVDTLSTRITIDASEYDSKDATTAAVIDTSNDDLATGDVLRIDVDVAGTSTAGLNVSILTRLP